MYYYMGFLIIMRPIWGKLRLKVFGKGVGEEPFLRKVFPEYLTYIVM